MVSRLSVAMKNPASNLPQSSLRAQRITSLCDKTLRALRSQRSNLPATLYGGTALHLGVDMATLSTEFAGLKLKNPIVAASAPPTETVDNIVACAEAGVGAVITKTSANFDPNQFMLGGRRTYIDGRGMWAQGTFRHETLTIEDGVSLVSESVQRVDIPIIASVGNLKLDPRDWLDSCLAMQDAGASMIQLDLFYVPQPRCSPENIQKLQTLLTYLSSHVNIPIAPKLNFDFPAYYAAELLRNTGISAVLLIDSLRVPVPIDIHKRGKSRIQYLEGASECSLFGEWQKPLTLQYTSIIYRKLGFPICAGGGLMSGWDAIEAMMWGANTIQFATAIIKHGYSQIRKIRRQMEKFILDNKSYSSISDVVGTAHEQLQRNGNEIFLPARASVNRGLCIDCGVCTKIVFCEDIYLDETGKVNIRESCNGCGLCPTVCPVAGALEIHPIGSPV